MKLLAVFALSLAIFAPGLAQDAMPGSALIESRQDELARLGVSIYGINVRSGNWTHHQEQVCPAFTHHVFARYDLTGSNGVASSFMAVYSLDVGPAKSLNKPWQGGIVLLPLYGIHPNDTAPPVARKETMSVFNRVWLDELQRSGRPGVVPGLTWSGLADCYLRLANEQPKVSPDTGEAQEQPTDLKTEPIGSVLIPLVSTSKLSRSAYIAFDKDGLITSAQVNESPNPGSPIRDRKL